jgi:hypothetical protein
MAVADRTVLDTEVVLFIGLTRSLLLHGRRTATRGHPAPGGPHSGQKNGLIRPWIWRQKRASTDDSGGKPGRGGVLQICADIGRCGFPLAPMMLLSKGRTPPNHLAMTNSHPGMSPSCNRSGAPRMSTTAGRARVAFTTLAVLSLAALPGGPLSAASFDCATAAPPRGNPHLPERELSALDEYLDRYYRAALRALARGESCLRADRGRDRGRRWLRAA